MRLEGRVSLITGAGGGIGRATALLFAREGASIVVADVDERGGTETADQIEQAGGRATFVRTNVTSPDDVQRMLDTAVTRFGKLDVLFNNAGLAMSFTPVEQTDEGLLDRLLDVNIKGVFLGCQYAVPIMKQQGGGVILNTASTAGIPTGSPCNGRCGSGPARSSSTTTRMPGPSRWPPRIHHGGTPTRPSRCHSAGKNCTRPIRPSSPSGPSRPCSRGTGIRGLRSSRPRWTWPRQSGPAPGLRDRTDAGHARPAAMEVVSEREGKRDPGEQHDGCERSQHHSWRR